MHAPDVSKNEHDEKSKLLVEENDKAETVAALMDLGSGGTEPSTGAAVEIVAATTEPQAMDMGTTETETASVHVEKGANGVGGEQSAESLKGDAMDVNGTSTPDKADSPPADNVRGSLEASDATGDAEEVTVESQTPEGKSSEGGSADTDDDKPASVDETVPMDMDEPPKMKEERLDVSMEEEDTSDEKKEELDEGPEDRGDDFGDEASAELSTADTQPVATTDGMAASSDALRPEESSKVDVVVEDENSGDKEAAGPAEVVVKTEAADSAKKEAGDVPATSAATDTSSSKPATATASPPPPLLKGTLSYNKEHRRHIIRGMWNYENSHDFPPQRFDLVRNLGPEEDVTELPKDGEFHGSFSFSYIQKTKTGKKKERSKVIPESGVNVKFTKVEGKAGEFRMDGTGSNQFGVFHVNGTATASTHENDPTFDVVLRKRYESTPVSAASTSALTAATGDSADNSKKRKLIIVEGSVGMPAGAEAVEGEGPLPLPSKSYPSGVVCLRGRLHREQSDDLGATEVVHRVTGMWSSGLDNILADPQNVKGLCNRFEYEHKCSQPNKAFPISGRYIGWFNLTGEDGVPHQIQDRDVTLKFRKNNAGYYNVEGRGLNVFGKYTITGTLSLENELTIFRQFQPRKVKQKVGRPGSEAKAKTHAASPPDLSLKLEDAEAPSLDTEADSLEPIASLANGMYSAVSRGVLRLNEDGSHSCSGKWAQTRDHFNNGQTNAFHFRLEAHHAVEAAAVQRNEKGKSDVTESQPQLSSSVSLSSAPTGSTTFPVDSAFYKGTFQMRRGATKYQRVVDQQIVLTFRKNKAGSYNVYGKGSNNIGVFKLMGTLILSGKRSGQIELYRVYPPRPALPPSVKSIGSDSTTKAPNKSNPPKGVASGGISLPGPPRPSLIRRESSRLTKLPLKLEEDDPQAQIARVMEKCKQILHQIQEKDTSGGAIFARPVDTVALRLPTYHQIVTRPMDLGTVEKKLEAKEIGTPEEFGVLMRLIFENAMSFNVEPTHPVHLAARSLLILFNQKFRDIERAVEGIRRAHKPSEAELARLKKEQEEVKRLKKKADKKRGRSGTYGGSSKKARLDEAQAMAAASATAMSSVVAAAPPTASSGGPVTRAEFNRMLQMIEQLQGQVVQTMNAVASLSHTAEPDDVASVGASADNDSVFTPAVEATRGPKKKARSKPKVTEKPKMVNVESQKPLTFNEQEELTLAINRLAQDHLQAIIEIIRESTQLGDEDEIDLEIDQLDTSTQRKLLRFVTKHAKPVKRSKKNSKKTNRGRSASQPAPRNAPPPAKKPAAAPKAESESFFAFGANNDSDSDSGDEVAGNGGKQFGGGKQMVPPPADNFNLGDGLGLHEEDEDDLVAGPLAANWSMAKPVSASAGTVSADVNEDDWGAAREEAAVRKAREVERKALEDKIHADAEMAKNQRLAEAAARGDEIRAQRMENEANEARVREEKEKEAEDARKVAREAAREQVKSVEQTVDLDAQRDLMKQIEQSFIDKELGSGGASPSSDFGF